MKTLKTKYSCSFTVLLISLLLMLPCPGVLKGAQIPSPDDVVARKAIAPTIDELTGGKVKKGDIIDKNNVDLVKEWLTPGCLEAVNQGMVLVMGTNSDYDDGVPKEFVELTEKNRGKAVMDTTGAVYYEKIGTPWPGGRPYPEPKTGLEAMSNAKYGVGVDDFTAKGVLRFINKKGKVYKTFGLETTQIWCSVRKYLSPLGTAPDYEGMLFRRTSMLTHPIEIKGQGQFSIRYYDDAKKYDTGFVYFPAYKRTLRISSTTWQDNIAGSDLIYGDSQGFNEPYVDWEFKLLGTKYFLIPEHKAPFAYLDEKGNINPKVKFDVGLRWPRLGWAVFPMHVVEARPKIKHVYGKKIIFTSSAPYTNATDLIEMVDIYDRQGKLWKLYCPHNGDWLKDKGFIVPYGVFVTDLQSQHMTSYWFKIHPNQNLRPGSACFKYLVSHGR
ncbi:MAG: DUF1329 domain-containing protein [Deltaproteobacteria bacterium]|nr:DUF1329 domain-containing protein [Deltaproteobacteria bacterium]